MLTIRLQRVGKRNRPAFRLVVTEHTNGPKSGRFLEVLGSHDRILKNTQLKQDRIQHWLAKGVQTSDAVQNILVEAGIMAGSKTPVHSTTPGKKKAEQNRVAAEEAEKAEEEAAVEAPVEEEVTEEAPAADTAETQENTEEKVKEEPEAEEEKKEESAES